MPVHFRVFAFLAALLFASPAAASDLAFEDWFKGRTTATGNFKTITGVDRSFKVNLHGRWNSRTLTLREDFVYDDGERDTKTWRFTKIGWNTYRGTREDVIGDTVVSVVDNKAWFNYRVDLDPGPGKQIVRFYDTLVLSEDRKTIANTARVFKGPLPVAKVRVDFKR